MAYKLSHEKKIVIASHNNGKVAEIKSFLSNFKILTTSASKLKLPEPEENGNSFCENAKIKAISASKSSGLVSLADDSGLCVHAIDNKPGIFSARWAGPKKDFTVAMNRLESELSGNLDKSAHFVCGLALAWPDGHWDYFEGKVFGKIQFPPAGINGFGYDPIFCPMGFQQTFAQISILEKNKITHRAKAFEILVKKHFS